MNHPYVLITPAKNEARHIERAIKSVIAQTLPPLKWVIVSDGSTDGTDAIIMKYQSHYPFIDLVRRESSNERNFGSKVKTIEYGLAQFEGLPYEFIGNLDADASFETDYYQKIIGHFKLNPRLGIAAGSIVEVIGGVRENTLSSPDSVGGIAQFFRRECWEQVGGYLPLRYGGEDSIAEIMARMNEWEVRRITDLQVLHHREMGTAAWGLWNRRFYQGRHFYALGHHPIFFFFKCLYRIQEKPLIFGSILLMMGYIRELISGEPLQIPKQVIQFLRKEQLSKLRNMLNLHAGSAGSIQNAKQPNF